MSIYSIYDNQTNSLCMFCNTNVGQYISKNGKICCSKHHSSCPAIISKRSEIFKELLPNGKTRRQNKNDNIKLGLSKSIDGVQIKFIKARKASKTKKERITDNGLTISENLSLLMKKTMTPEEAKRRSEIANITKREILPNGLTIAQDSSRKASITKFKIDANSGLTLHQIASRKAMKTMSSTFINGKSLLTLRSEKINEAINSPNDQGLTPIEIGRLRALKTRMFKDTNIYYQGSYEKSFLTILEIKHGINWIKLNVRRGPALTYLDNSSNTIRKYQSDFCIGDKLIVEVKSDYWLRKELIKNVSKFESAISYGFRIRIFNGESLLTIKNIFQLFT